MTEEPNHLRTRKWCDAIPGSLVLRIFGSLVLLPSTAAAQDVVISSSPSDSTARIRREGQILDYTGTELKLRTTLGTSETIPSSRVLEIETRWTPSHEAGRIARAEGRLDDAIAALRQSKREETRGWAIRQVMADLCGCYLEAGQVDRAGDEFLAIVGSDPSTRHLDVIPIAWRGAALESPVEARASSWLAARNVPVAPLLGASWLLATHRGAAMAALEEISKSTDQRLAGLAVIQLWRTKLVVATSADVRLWQAQLEKMPPEIQAAGWYVLGDAFARQNEAGQAILAYLKVPLLFRGQRAMAADALLAAGKQLEKMSQAGQAAGLYRELVRDFPSSPAAAEAQSRLERLSASTAK